MKTFLFFMITVILFAFVSDSVVGQPRETIAAVSFQNSTGDESLDFLKTSIPDQIITLLAGGGVLRIVERAALELAIEEQKLGLTEYLDPTKAARIGQMSGATAIIVGTLSNWSERTFSITARLVSTETGLVIAAESVQGPRDELLPLCRDIAASFRNVLLKPPPKKSSPVYKKWWFWGGVTAAGAGAALVLSGGDSGPQFTDVIIDIRLP